MIMTGYETFGIFQALKLHFTQESYDYFKYNGKTNITITSFENRKDKYHFYKLSRKFTNKEDLIDFLVANLVEDNNIWVGNLLNEDADNRHLKYKKVLQSLSYVFENDCHILFDDLDNPNDIIKTDGHYPILLTKALRKEIHIQTLVLLNNMLGFIPMWSKKITDTIHWPNYRMKVLKIASFLPKDSVKFKLILKKAIHV
jgi:hypothetical protein